MKGKHVDVKNVTRGVGATHLHNDVRPDVVGHERLHVRDAMVVVCCDINELSYCLGISWQWRSEE